MGSKRDHIDIRLFGPFSLTDENGNDLRIGSKKQKIILALLATAPDGTRNRSYIEDLLWSLTGKEQAQGNLRQAVLALRRSLNTPETELISADHVSVRLDMDRVTIRGGPDSGEFLEGINLPHELGFNTWVKSQRQDIKPAVPSGPVSLLPGTDAILRPMISVIPFSSPDPDSGKIVGDMIAESLISALSRSNLVNVISHLSSRTLDPRTVSMPQIRDHLKADHVVTGRIRVGDDKVTLETEVVHVGTGQIQGGYQGDFSLKDYLSNDAGVIEDVATSIGRCLFSSSVRGARTQVLSDVACHDLMMSGVFLMHQQALAGFSVSRQYLEEVVSRVPGSAIPLAWLSKWYVLSIQQGWSTDVAKDALVAQDYAARALDTDPTCSFSLSVDGFVQNNLLKNYDAAMDRFDEALSLDPSNPLSWLLKGTLHAFMDLGEEAVQCTDRARKLSPLDPHKYFFDSLSATAALSNQEFEKALRLADRSLKANVYHTSTRRVRTIALERMGRHEEAQRSAKTLLKLEPTLTIRRYLTQHPAANFETGRDWAEALRSAGVPEV